MPKIREVVKISNHPTITIGPSRGLVGVVYRLYTNGKCRSYTSSLCVDCKYQGGLWFAALIR